MMNPFLSPVLVTWSPGGLHIRRDDVLESKFGFTPGCKGCEAANRGSTGIHNEACRNRTESRQLSLSKEPERNSKVLETIGMMAKEDMQAQESSEVNQGGMKTGA